MKRPRLRQVLVFALAIFFALGASASVLQATGMAVKMASASGTGHANDGACGKCGNDGADMKATGCDMAACTASAVAALPQAVSAIGIITRELPASAVRLLVGWSASPDPHPPRASDLG